jgi:hypothetical protein
LAIVDAVRWEKDQGWIALDFVLLTERLGEILGAVNFGEVDIFVVFVKFGPGWSKVLAMAAPRCEEFYKPRFVPVKFVGLGVNNQVKEVG